ncbi:MAG TPA: potassium transporter [Gammaproteobacteria bacterium]|nr:potassium transporter [Gammaproteobacteria bacterium]|tara:strand:+ start:307 stop:1758 length:1452 start_codon:yes stop_codon:yes gene_type:complete
MRLRVIQKILGLLLSTFSLALVPPLLLAHWFDDGATQAFFIAIAVIFSAGLILWWPVRKIEEEIKLRDGFIIVVMFWVVLGAIGSIPFMLVDELNMSLPDAIFESLSGLTTTGATVIVGIDHLPPSILFYRQLLQWLGGMGIIVLAVAILPILGVGGMQLYRAETPGPMKDAKLTPRITETAKALWYIYLGLTLACALAYFLSGMGPFDAITHSFSTVAIGGFSTHDSSLGYFDNPLIEAVAVFFMFLAGINFSLHFLAWRNRNAKYYIFDSEFKLYATVTVIVCLLCGIGLSLTLYQGDWIQAFRVGIFQAVSIGTTTGFTTTSFQSWPGFLPVLLIFSSFIGACAGSTGGGIKVIRVLLLYKQGRREIQRLVHPSAIITIKMGGRPVSGRVVDAVWGFFVTYIAVFALLLLSVMAAGLDQITAFSAVAACFNNLGPGLGEVSSHYGALPSNAKMILGFAMVLGRLEIFTLLVLLTPAFWRA